MPTYSANGQPITRTSNLENNDDIFLAQNRGKYVIKILNFIVHKAFDTYEEAQKWADGVLEKKKGYYKEYKIYKHD